MSIRILLVDNHQILREDLRLVINKQTDMEVASAVGSGRDALLSVEKLSPDLIIMDTHMQDMNGIEASRQILVRFPQIKIVMLSALSDRDLVDQALKAGVSGYLVKSNAADELVWAIRAVMAGKTYLSPDVMTPIVSYYMKRLKSHKPASAPPMLSPRECEVLKLTAEGLKAKEIADRLNIGTRTAETYRARLMKKLGCRSSVEMTRYAIREGIAAA